MLEIWSHSSSFSTTLSALSEYSSLLELSSGSLHTHCHHVCPEFTLTSRCSLGYRRHLCFWSAVISCQFHSTVSPYSYVTWKMYNRSVGGRSAETLSKLVDINNNNNNIYLLYERFLNEYLCNINFVLIGCLHSSYLFMISYHQSVSKLQYLRGKFCFVAL